VCALNRNDPSDALPAREDLDTLSFVKLDPQGMLSNASCFSQSQITSVGNLADGKTGPIERAGNYASRSSATFAQKKIARTIALPSR